MIIEPLPGGERLRVKLTPLENAAGITAAEAQGDETLVDLFGIQSQDFAERSGMPMESLRPEDPVATHHILRVVCDAAIVKKISTYVVEGNELAAPQTTPLPHANEPPPDYPGFLHLVK